MNKREEKDFKNERDKYKVRKNQWIKTKKSF